MKATLTESSQAGARFARKGTIAFAPDTVNVEGTLVCLFPNEPFQSVAGFGGAFTEAAATTLGKLPDAAREKVLRAYFDPQGGIGYNFCRTHIGSCDFSLGNYAYVEEGDGDLSTFCIDRDRASLIPMIKEAKRYGDFALFASPWSPPAYMKTTGEMNRGGKLKPEYQGLWAKYIARYIEEYKKEGIDIWAVTVQNEPNATQPWDSCLYTGEEERDFIKHHLGEQLAPLGVKIMVWDHNRERVYERGCTVLDDPIAARYVCGTACHWYSGDHFEQLSLLHRRHPDKCIVFSEGCHEYRSGDASDWDIAVRYAHDIIGDFNNYCTAFTDWNLLLDETGGPNHAGNFCHAPVMADTRTGEVTLNSAYYAIGHFSRFVKRGAVRIGLSKYTDQLEACAFQNPDGSAAVILLNRTDAARDVILRMHGQIADTVLDAHSIVTAVIEE